MRNIENSGAAIKYIILILLVLVNGVHAGKDTQELFKYYGFEELRIIKTDWATGGLNVSDINGDGKNDLVLANNRRAKIEIYLQGDGDGNNDADEYFGGDENVNEISRVKGFVKHELPVSEKIYSLRVCDLNSDGKKDLVYYGSPKGLYVIYQKKEGNIPGWGAPVRVDIKDGLVTSSGLECGDYDNDGRNDIAVAGQGHFYFVLQDEEGSLTEPRKYSSAGRILGFDQADLNGDGLIDIVLVTDDKKKPLYVSFGREEGFPGPQVKFEIERPAALISEDVYGSDDDEVLVVDAVTGRLICYDLENTKESEDWLTEYYALPAGNMNNERDVSIADVTGDGKDDIVVSLPDSAELLVYKNGKSGLSKPVRYPAFSEIDKITAVNADEDEAFEIAVLSVKEKTIGISDYQDDRLTFPESLETIDTPLAVDFGNFDDGKGFDCVYVCSDANNTKSLRIIRDIDKNLKADEDILLEFEDMQANPEDMKLIDADGDGLLDVLVFVKYEDPVFVKQVSQGKFKVSDGVGTKASLIKDATANNLAVVDLDQMEGKVILLAKDNFARSLVVKDDKWQVLDQYNARRTDEISVAGAFELGDGEKEKSIVLFDSGKGLVHLLKYEDQNKTYTIAETLETGDWSSSGKLKVMQSSLYEGVRSLVIFDGSKFAVLTGAQKGFMPLNFEQKFVYETKIKDGSYGNIVCGDVNSDSVPDLVMVDYKKNHLEILTFNNGGDPVAAYRFKLFEQKHYQKQKNGKAGIEPREMKIADVTGDGKKDLITLIHDRIIIYPQD